MIPYTYCHLKKIISAAGIKVPNSNNINSERKGQALFIRGSALTILSSLGTKPLGSDLRMGLLHYRITPQATILNKLSEVSWPLYTIVERLLETLTSIVEDRSYRSLANLSTLRTYRGGVHYAQERGSVSQQPLTSHKHIIIEL